LLVQKRTKKDSRKYASSRFCRNTSKSIRRGEKEVRHFGGNVNAFEDLLLFTGIHRQRRLAFSTIQHL
jgi:hypothetical protein